VIKPIDVENGIGFNTKKCPALEDMVKSFGLVDAFRKLHPSKKEFTFIRGSCAKSRLDRF
jgi:exonuclease III